MKHKPNLMLQGTASSVGKSVLTAAFCRIFKEDGYRVAPFKSQNMSLNSYITEEGLEMGRAQVFQAEAAGVKPVAAMNPILLKPSGDKTSQVILGGKVWKNMTAMEYHQVKTSLKETVKDYYRSVEDQVDIMVLEGAGSPAEINLQENDLVNMGMADLVDAPVLLIGDIDRGGVFASLVGTLMLLPEEQRKRVKGLLINKFRGDEAILKPGLDQLEALTGVPVLGVVPHGEFDIEEEDGTAQRLNASPVTQNTLRIAVIRLPRISNFTDFHWLEKVPGVSVQYVTRREEVGVPDLLIIPGTKNTLEDLAVLRERGIDQAILKAHESGSMICGVCGGFQMLGTMLHDPHRVESQRGSMEGLGLLASETVFNREKTTIQAEGHLCESPLFPGERVSDQRIKGYEIHMGQTELHHETTPFSRIKGENENQLRCDGGVSADGSVWGTYLHGIFDNRGFLLALLRRLSGNPDAYKELETMPDFQAYKEAQYDALALTVRRSVNLPAIYELMGLEGGRK